MEPHYIYQVLSKFDIRCEAFRKYDNNPSISITKTRINKLISRLEKQDVLQIGPILKQV